jgi:DnaJ-class molecular chaperone
MLLISFADGSLWTPDVSDSSILNLLTFGDQCTQPDTETGDIVFVLQLKDHPKFKRKGDDLFVQHTLTLTEALCGFQFPLTHLDGRQLLIKCSPGEIVKPGVCMCSFLDSPSPFIIFFFAWKNSSLFQNWNPLLTKQQTFYLWWILTFLVFLVFLDGTKKPGQCKAVNDEGMPHYQRPFMKGRLYIQFSVDFPETGSLSPDQCKAIEAILPPRPSSADMTDMELDECEETTLLDVNIEDEMRRKQQQQQEAYEEDEESSGGPRVQCAQQ